MGPLFGAVLFYLDNSGVKKGDINVKKICRAVFYLKLFIIKILFSIDFFRKSSKNSYVQLWLELIMIIEDGKPFMEMDKLLIKTGRSYFFVDKNDINFIESESNYSRIFCDGKNYIVKRSLNYLEEKLGGKKFLRINRYTIVNIERINEMKELKNNDYVIILKNNKTIQWGRRYREKLVKLIKI